MRLIVPVALLGVVIGALPARFGIAVLLMVVLGAVCVSWYPLISWRLKQARNVRELKSQRASLIVMEDRAGSNAATRSDVRTETAPKGLVALVVDDDRLVTNTCCAMLSALGVRCVAAQNGEEALVRAKAYGAALNLVILDLMMPGLSVVEILKKLRQQDPTLPVVIATGWDRSQVHPEVLHAPNVRKIMFKPFDFDELRSACSMSRNGDATEGFSIFFAKQGN